MPTLRVISAHQASDGVVQPQLCYLSEVIGQPFTPLAFTLTSARAICRSGKMAPFSRLSTLHHCGTALRGGKVKEVVLGAIPQP